MTSETRQAAILVCPETKRPLRPCSIEEAESLLAAGERLVSRGLPGKPPIGRTPTVMLEAGNRWAYPVIDGLPMLLAPERLVAPGSAERTLNLPAARYAEASEEMRFYNAEAERQVTAVSQDDLPQDVARLLQAPEGERAAFPAPRALWIDAVYDSLAEWDAYRHIAPLRGSRVLQLGGKGSHTTKFLLGGAAEAWLLSPMARELAHGRALARRCGVEDRFGCAGGVAEELPFADGSFDAIYAGGCVHHMVTEEAFAECARVLRPGGRLAAVEPWRAPFYGIGTRLLGKREPDVHCRPMTAARTKPLFTAFQQAEVIHHGALTRYALLALWKCGLHLSLPLVWSITRLDDALCAPFPWMRRSGSSVSLLATKAGPSPVAAPSDGR